MNIESRIGLTHKSNGDLFVIEGLLGAPPVPQHDSVLKGPVDSVAFFGLGIVALGKDG
jgi:hypothetical protein